MSDIFGIGILLLLLSLLFWVEEENFHQLLVMWKIIDVHDDERESQKEIIERVLKQGEVKKFRLNYLMFHFQFCFTFANPLKGKIERENSV